MKAKYVHRSVEQHYLEAEKQLTLADEHDAAALENDARGDYALANASAAQRDYAVARAQVHATLAGVLGEANGVAGSHNRVRDCRGYEAARENAEDWRGVGNA